MAKRTALILVTAAVLAALAAAAGVAGADPVNSKNAQIITIDCGGEQVTVATISNNNAVVVNVVSTTGNFVLTRVEGTETFTDPETGEVVENEFEFSIGQGEKRGLGRSLTTCDTTLSFEDPELGTITLDVSVTGFFTPRRG